jgi:transcriptional regulator with XRE-family HTH domain
MNRKQTEIAKLIALARELKGWTLRDLEKETKISNALISQIETGHVKDPGFHTVMALCAALGISGERIAKAAQDERFLKVLR